MIRLRNGSGVRSSTRRRRPGFSIIEMLIALTISAALLTAAMASLHTMFQHYKSTTESASTHVVSRMVMHRMLTMIRTGSDFGPIPANVLDAAQNPLISDHIEFVSQRDMQGGIERVTRIEFRPGAQAGEAGELWFVLLAPGEAEPIIEQRPLLSGVRQATFTLRFNERTWRLDRAEIDMTIEPNDSVDLTIAAETTPQTIRLIASAAPRQLF